jgi:hypothetical protein
MQSCEGRCSWRTRARGSTARRPGGRDARSSDPGAASWPSGRRKAAGTHKLAGRYDLAPDSHDKWVDHDGSDGGVNGHAEARIPAEEQGKGDHRQGKHQDSEEEATPFPSTMRFQASDVKARSSSSPTEAGGEGPRVIWQYSPSGEEPSDESHAEYGTQRHDHAERFRSQHFKGTEPRNIRPCSRRLLSS